MSSSISSQLDLLGFPSEIARHRKNLLIEKIYSFADKYVIKLINKFGISTVQAAIDSDSSLYDPVINYITCIMELGMLHELLHQSYAISNPEIMNERMELLAWAVNIAVATSMKSNGINRIPELADGKILIYFTWNNMEEIIKRIWPIASQIDGAVPAEVENYINNLISTKL
jgi:hypothetical protein